MCSARGFIFFLPELSSVMVMQDKLQTEQNSLSSVLEWQFTEQKTVIKIVESLLHLGQPVNEFCGHFLPRTSGCRKYCLQKGIRFVFYDIVGVLGIDLVLPVLRAMKAAQQVLQQKGQS